MAASWPVLGRGGPARVKVQPAVGTTRPTHSPRPIRTAPSRSHQARKVISSPSSRKLRVSPLGSSIGCFPPRLISSSEPSPSSLSVDRVPGADQIAGLEVAAVRRVVRHDLRRAPVHGGDRPGRATRRAAPGPRRASSRSTASPRARCRAPPLSRSAASSEIGQRRRIAVRTRPASACGTAPARPRSPPTAKRWSGNSWRGTARAADIPTPAGRAPTSR